MKGGKEHENPYHKSEHLKLEEAKQSIKSKRKKEVELKVQKIHWEVYSDQ